MKNKYKNTKFDSQVKTRKSIIWININLKNHVFLSTQHFYGFVFKMLVLYLFFHFCFVSVSVILLTFFVVFFPDAAIQRGLSRSKSQELSKAADALAAEQAWEDEEMQRMADIAQWVFSEERQM